MSIAYILLVVSLSVGILLLLILRFKINAFIALLATSIIAGLLAGMPLDNIVDSIRTGMGNTLGFVAVVVGLGAVFGQMLQSSGGAHALAQHLLSLFGQKRASWAMLITGFVVAIPVFFDVGLIILVPMVYALSRDTKLSLLHYGIPLVAGLAVTHAFLPPTPGPIAVADILGAELGWVIIFGVLIGLPTAMLAGPVFGKYIANKIDIRPPDNLSAEVDDSDLKPSFPLVVALVGLPLILILQGTLVDVLVNKGYLDDSTVIETLVFLGHPFMALLIATAGSILFAMRSGLEQKQILNLSTDALGPAGIIILVTGAGGVLKQVLIDSGMGQVIAESLAELAFPAILLAWLLAASVRITQGSATVAMITAAGIMAPVLPSFGLSAPETALVAIAISSGGTAFSHVNDSGFWLVSRYFGMTESQTLQSLTVTSTIIGLGGLFFALLLSIFI